MILKGFLPETKPGRKGPGRLLHGSLSALLLALLTFFPFAHALDALPGAPVGGPLIGTQPQQTQDVFIPDPKNITVETFVDGLEVPWDLVFLPGGNALLTERPGRLRLIREGRVMERPYASFDTAAVGEGGLMGLAVHPGYPAEPYLYVMYTYREGTNLYNRVERLKDTGSTAEPDRVIVEGIPGARVHDGGRIAFGPDGMLYVCTGDASSPDVAQDLRSLGGKILRLAPDGAIPRDNPFKGSPVWAYGLRNPQGLAWHPSSGELFCSNHGPSGEFGLRGMDSINMVRKGGNYGWPLVLGAVGKKPFIDPVVLWVEATPPAGMTFFQDRLYVTTLRGEALIRIGVTSAEKGPAISSIERLFADSRFSGKYGRLRSVVAGPDSRLYVLTSNRDGRGNPEKRDDRVLRITVQQHTP